MKRIALVLCGATVLLFACNNNKTESATEVETTPANDTAKVQTETWVPVDSATAMKAWIEFATPGPVHQMMASWNGNWKGEMSSYMSEGAPPMVAHTTATNSMILEGRYQQSRHSGSYDNMPFEGMGTLAYDNSKKQFISSWVDNMGTGIMILKGTWDEASKTITMTGTQTDPSRGKDCNVREVYRIIDDNNHLMEMYGPDPMTGKEFKMMEIKLSRK